ncbi:MAG: hypothetical protein WEC17_00320 [Candidatus Saccharimonadales bacterium]
MSPESRPEITSNNPWSILHGRFIPDLPIYKGHIKALEAKVKQDWKDDVMAPRVLVANVVQSAVEMSQPELFSDEVLRDRVAKDIGSSVFACYSYNGNKLALIEEKASEEIDLGSESIPALETLHALLEDSEITLPSGHDLNRVCRASVLHVLLKQRCRGEELPRPSYN